MQRNQGLLLYERQEVTHFLNDEPRSNEVRPLGGPELLICYQPSMGV